MIVNIPDITLYSTKEAKKKQVYEFCSEYIRMQYTLLTMNDYPFENDTMQDYVIFKWFYDVVSVPSVFNEYPELDNTILIHMMLQRILHQEYDKIDETNCKLYNIVKFINDYAIEYINNNILPHI